MHQEELVAGLNGIKLNGHECTQTRNGTQEGGYKAVSTFANADYPRLFIST